MIDETRLRRLAYVKSLYNISRNQLEKGSDIEISRGILSLDNCVEAFFWIVLDKKIPEKVKQLHGKHYSDLTREVQNHVKDLDVNSFNELHMIRNNIQHNGILPAKSQVFRYFSVSEKMFQIISEEIFAIKWQNLSMSMLIEHAKIAELCHEAEKSYESKDIENATKKLIMSFEIAKAIRQFNQFGSGILGGQISAQEVANEIPKIKPLVDYMDKLHEEVEIMKLGLDYMKWREYRLPLGTLSPYKFLYDDMEFRKEFVVTEEMNLFNAPIEEMDKWFRNNISFVIESILRWQDSRQESAWQFPWDTISSSPEIPRSDKSFRE